jgi:hypothetical protein
MNDTAEIDAVTGWPHPSTPVSSPSLTLPQGSEERVFSGTVRLANLKKRSTLHTNVDDK